ncbi:MAPEG family protein [Aurantimonas sp. VKM B-3413]|uniref:MAPEG family protein n=1 Tax=Aurantimonas sp. VKM B-3413 TaxID=2779401 RepID=UPI001E59A031|nr:MAPEG family protein [Aurantimonas sp. VKM B-3413]MCB8839988.1 MAPEG family protein [Aurantimonas sp. VKM B-3413]
MTGNIAIFWPMIVQAGLTLAVYPVLMMRRQRGSGGDNAAFARAANGLDQAGPGYIAGRNLANQYELPVLFFAVCLSLYVTNGATWFVVVLAWVFALSRLVHAAIHLGPNIVPLRGAAFGIGYLCVGVLWLLLAWHVFNVGAVVGAPA